MLKNFKYALKKEFMYYLLTLLILTLIAHSDLLSDPFARFNLMQEKENYFHPILYSLVIYSVILIIRKTIDAFVGLFEKKSD
jgi:hypothetical protein